jgi:hypothetical protein
MTGMYPYTQFFPLRWEAQTFLPGLDWNCDPPDFRLPSSYNYCSEIPVPCLVSSLQICKIGKWFLMTDYITKDNFSGGVKNKMIQSGRCILELFAYLTTGAVLLLIPTHKFQVLAFSPPKYQLHMSITGLRKQGNSWRVHTWNPSTQETESGQPGLHNNTLSGKRSHSRFPHLGYR